MQRISERIIVTVTTFIFVFLGSHLSLLAYGKILEGSSIQHLVNTGVILMGVMWISLFSIIFMVNSYRSHPRKFGG